MTSTLIRARPNQIAELTQGLHLPLPQLQQSHLVIIAESLAFAFEDLRRRQVHIVTTGTEAEVTALLQSRLIKLLEEDLFWSQLVLSVSRGSESLSVDGSHLEKRPDLSLSLSNRDRLPLVVEAKIIDRNHAKTVTLYADNGIRRFITGEYAWGRREGMMIAYVRDDSSIAASLTPLLLQDMGTDEKTYCTEALPSSMSGVAPTIAQSRHSRSFTYVNRQPPAHLPGSIAIWHLWLSCLEG